MSLLDYKLQAKYVGWEIDSFELFNELGSTFSKGPLPGRQIFICFQIKDFRHKIRILTLKVKQFKIQ